MQDRAARKVQVTRLFSSWLSAAGNVDMDNINAFVEATADVSLEALTRSVEQFTSGKVERNNAFPPSSAELAENARLWESALRKNHADDDPPLHNGLLNVDFGRGKIDMRGLTAAEQDAVMDMKGIAPDGRSMCGMSLEQIREAVSQGQIAGPRTVAPQLQRMG